MNRNQESRFAVNPQINIKRSQFKRPSRHLTTANAGSLFPIYVDEVLPGDTFKMKTSKLVRLTTSKFPTMDNLSLDTFFFYVPSRLLWDHWEQMNGANDQPWFNNTEYHIPKITISGQVASQSLLDYLGIPPGNYAGIHNINALPVRAYYKIWNDYFRDQNLQADCVVYTSDSNLSTTYYKNENSIACTAPNSCCHVAKFHDYFTSALPKPQKADDVIIPTGDSVVKLLNNPPTGAGNAPFFTSLVTTSTGNLFSNYSSASGDKITVGSDSSALPQYYNPNGSLVASGFQITVNSLRLAVQTQKLFEKDARGGTRYNEILVSHFGVTSPDSRLQRSEYLGGKRVPINMVEVIQNSSTSGTNYLGNVAGYSATGDTDDSFTKSFVEHGYIIGVACIRTERTYSQGLEKLWFKDSRFDHYWPVLANIGEQPILNKEIYWDKNATNTNEEVFGYQEGWAEYRYKFNRLSGLFRSGITSSLDAWHYGDYYAQAPRLSSTWIQQGPTEVDRTLTVQSASAPQFICDFFFDLVCTRPMPMYSIPGYMDHF